MSQPIDLARSRPGTCSGRRRRRSRRPGPACVSAILSLSISRFASTSGLGSCEKLPVISKRIGMISQVRSTSPKTAGTILPGHAVAGVDRDAAACRFRSRNCSTCCRYSAPEVHLLVLALQPGLPDAQRRGDALDVVQPAGGADRLGLGAADLEAVVLDRIVRRGGHDAADGVEVVDREVDERRVDHADVDHVHPDRADAVDQRLGQVRRAAAACRGRRRRCPRSLHLLIAGKVLPRCASRNCAVAWPTFQAASSFSGFGYVARTS